MNPDGGGSLVRSTGVSASALDLDVAQALPDVNTTENITMTTTVGTLQNSELIALVVIGFIGLAGTVMNIGVLIIVYKGRLVKKDYRMAYYLFITVGDLMFAIHTVINALSILYRDLYVFKIFAVCLNLHVTFGLVPYQWSAACIILLIIDLIWSLKNPFGDDKPKKTFLKISCISTFIGGISFGLIPFAIWNDSPNELEFCSIANVYGSHWSVYQIEAVSVLSVLFLMMLAASIVLMYILHRTHKPENTQDSRTENRMGTKEDVDNAMKPPRVFDIRSDLRDIDPVEHPSPHPKKKHDVTMMKHDAVMSCGQTNDSKLESISLAFAKKGGDHANSNHTQLHGIDNTAYVCEEGANYIPPIQVEILPQDTKSEEHLCKKDVQRKQLHAAFRNVGSFMATYLGSCLPYYILLIITTGCSPACNQDTPEQRIIRVVVAAFLYMLPILDPILYTVRFAIFKRTALEILEPCFRCLRRNNNGMKSGQKQIHP